MPHTEQTETATWFWLPHLGQLQPATAATGGGVIIGNDPTPLTANLAEPRRMLPATHAMIPAATANAPTKGTDMAAEAYWTSRG